MMKKGTSIFLVVCIVSLLMVQPAVFAENSKGDIPFKIIANMNAEGEIEGVFKLTKNAPSTVFQIAIGEYGEKKSVFKKSIIDGKKINIPNLKPDIKYSINVTFSSSKKNISTKDTMLDSYTGNFKIVTKENKCKAILMPIIHQVPTSKSNDEISTKSYPDEDTSNDYPSEADRIYDDEDVYGYIDSSSDIDWFKVRFTEDGEANFWVDVPSNLDYDLYLYDSLSNAEDDDYVERSIEGSGSDELISSYPVQSDQYYYIKVEGYGGDYSTQESYHLRTKNYPYNNIEPDDYEPNDYFSSAERISGSGETLYANIHNEDDEDYYKFTLSGEAEVDIQLTSIPSGNDYDLKLYDDNYDKIDSSTAGGNDSDEIIQTLDEGTYYIKVYSYDGFGEDTYRLEVDINQSFSQKRQEILEKAKDMIDVQWTPTSDLKGWKHRFTFEANTTYDGIPYSQTAYQVDDSGFYEALNKSDFYNTYYRVFTGSDGTTYKTYMPKYGNDCSGFTSFVWGIPRHTTYTFNKGIISGEFSKVGNYDVNNPSRTDLLNSYDELQPGDAVVARSEHKHVFIIKEREEGTDNFICYEQTPYFCRFTNWTKTKLADYEYKPFTLNELANKSTFLTVSNIGEMKDICLLDNNIKNNKLSLYKRKYSKESNNEYYLKLYSIYDNNHKIEITEDDEVEWISSNNEVATIFKGNIRTMGEGECTITARYKGKEVSVNVSVFDSEPIEMKMPDNIILNRKGDSEFIDVNVMLPNGETVNINKAAIWETMDSNVAIGYDGRILAEGTGKTEIKVSFGNLSKKIKVTVLEDN
ncbi:PPC domain-containing protein [Caldisalinibacter kiritimatiensis]|uniref:Peptidase C-terminal archaeal/bacterial domain-containing protein n=1 Tax=Caldisalinibacter kiritimatiensis TaxID=1304284 RepID=R1CWZ7_9FIRM|nr:pre-peptidase C-terminal domain-containing protein [Caldisalinibacter kiritimatiensis]EOD01149.1 hypothetical protein L21TH_0780 [Caldisalinibacter kiritimatiensis]